MTICREVDGERATCVFYSCIFMVGLRRDEAFFISKFFKGEGNSSQGEGLISIIKAFKKFF